MEIRLRINELIEERGLNIKQFSEQSGFGYRTAWELVKGNPAQVRVATMAKLCDFFACKPGDLFKVS
jgi:DNA-binding Xre family transcriptional regulator